MVINLIADDFYNVLERGDAKSIRGDDIQMALWLAVQELTEEVNQLKSSQPVLILPKNQK